MWIVWSSPAIITKVVIEKNTILYLAIAFSKFSLTDSIFYSLLAFKYYFVWKKKCERDRDRDRKKENKRENNNKKFCSVNSE